jgi:hypothetical protein
MFEKLIPDNVFRRVWYEIFRYHRQELLHRKRLLLTKKRKFQNENFNEHELEMLLIVIEFHYEDKCLNYQDEIDQKVSFHESATISEMNERLNNHSQLKESFYTIYLTIE